MKRSRKPRSKPALANIMGEAEDWSDGDIARMAGITSEDVASAKAHFQRLAPKRLRHLLADQSTTEKRET